MKNSEVVRSHSWWWNSHISPKNSKWLRESLADMDSKISAMLKIIEQDADSFAQRAEMYYRRRPELVNLVEEFYRAYRALAERYSSLTGELRQKFRAHYGLPSSDSSQRPHSDPHRKKGLHGFDPLVVSLHSVTERLDYNEDVENDDSSKELKFLFDDGAPFLSYTEAESEDDNCKPLTGLLEKSKGANNGPKIDLLQREIHQLVGENKQLREVASTHADCRNKHELQLSELQKQIRNLDAEEKQIRNRLQAAIEQEHALEIENSKLNNARLALEEEKTEMAMLYARSREDCKLTSKQVKDLEEDLFHLKQETSKVGIEASARAEKIRMLEEEGQKLHSALLTVQQEKEERELELQRCIQQLQIVEEKLLNLQVKISNLQAENSSLKDELANEVARIENLQQQLLESHYSKMALEGEIHAKEVTEEELKDKLWLAIEQVQKLESEIQRLEQSLHKLQMVECKVGALEQEILQLQEENRALETIRLDGIMHIEMLEKELQECEREREAFHNEMGSCMEQLRELQEEISNFKEQKQLLSNELAESASQFQEAKEEICKLQKDVTALEKELSMQLIVVANWEEDGYKLSEENKQLATRLETKTKQLQEHDESMLKLQQVLMNQREENIELTENTTKMTKDYSMLLEDLKQLNAYLCQLQEENQQIRIEASAKLANLRDLEKEIAQLNREKYALSVEVALKAQQAAMLQKDLTEQTKRKEELEEAVQARVAKVRILEEKILMLQQLILNLQLENKTLEESSCKAEESCKDLQEELNQANKEVDFLRNENVQRQVEVANQVKAMEKLEGELSELQEGKKGLEEEILSNIKKMDNLQEEIRKLQEEQEQLNSMMQRKVEELQDRDREIQLLHERIHRVEEANVSLGDFLSRSRNDCVVSGNKLAELLEQFTLLKKENSHYGDEILNKNAHEKELAEEICRLQTENKALLEDHVTDAKQLQSWQQEVCNLKMQEKLLKDDLQAREDEITKLQFEIQKLEQSLNHSKQDTAELKKCIERDIEEYTSIKETVAKMQEDVAELQQDKANLIVGAAIAEAFTIELKERISTLQKERIALEDAIISKEEMSSRLQTQADTLFEKEKELDEKLKAGTMEIVTLKNEKEVQDVEIHKLLTELTSIQQENATLKEQCQWQAENLQSKGRQIQEIELEILTLHDVVLCAAKEDVGLKDEGQRNFKQKQVIDLKEEFLRLKKEEERLATKSENDAAYISMLEYKLLHSTGENSILEDRPCKTIDECNSLKAKVLKLEEDLFDVKEENTDSEDEISFRVVDVKELEEIMSSPKCDKSGYEEKSAAGKDWFDKTEEENMLTQKNNEIAKPETLNSDVHDAREKECEERISQLQEVKITVKAELSSTMVGVKHLQEESDKLQKEKRILDGLLLTREKEIKTLHEGLSNLKEMSEAARNFNIADQEALEKSKAITDELQRKNGVYERQIDELKKQIFHLQEENGRLEAEASDEVGKLEDGMFSTKNMLDVNRLQQEMQQLHEERESICTQLEDKLEEVQDLEIEMEKLHEILLGMQREIKCLRDERQIMCIMHHEEGKDVKDNSHNAQPTSCLEEKDVMGDCIVHHVNLGNRLHQEVIDDKMQQEVGQVQEGHKKVRLRLELCTEHIDKLQVDLEKVRDLVVSPVDENDCHKETIRDQQWELVKRDRLNKSLSELEERILLLQEKKDAVGVEVKADTKKSKKIKGELLILMEQEKASSFESWEVQACKLHAEVQRLQENNQKHLNITKEMDEQIEKMQLETQNVYHQGALLKEEHNFPLLQAYKSFSMKHYREQAFSWLINGRTKRLGSSSRKPASVLMEASAGKKRCRCCMCGNPDTVAE